MLLVIMLQALVPILAFFGTPPVRFGFQMFAGYETHDSLVVRDSQGDEISVGGEFWSPSLRPELDWSERYPAHACSHVPGAHDVVVSQYGTGQEVLPCP